MNAPDNTIRPLRLKLPKDFAVQAGVKTAIKHYLEDVEDGEAVDPSEINAPRFTGFFFRNGAPHIVVPPGFGYVGFTAQMSKQEGVLARLQSLANKAVGHDGLSFTAAPGEIDPMYVFIHDSYDGSCHLQIFEYGTEFLLAAEPVVFRRQIDNW